MPFVRATDHRARTIARRPGHRKWRWRCIVLTTSPLLLLVPQTLAAQDTTDPNGDKPDRKDIVVSGRRLPAKRTLEGVVYSTGDHAQGVAGTAADLLNTVPSVHVAPDGRVTIRGDAKVRIFVDGRPSAALNGPDRGAALEALSGGSIASVELLTNPSVRYDAQGGMILNLVMKKARGEGVRGRVTGNVGDRGRRTLSGNATVQAGRVKASIDMALRDDVRLMTVDDDRLLLDRDGRVARRFVTRSRYSPTHSRSANLTASLSYALTDKGEIGVETTLSEGSPINRIFEEHRDSVGQGEPDSLYRRVRAGTYRNDERDLSLYYREKPSDTHGSLSIEAQHEETGLRADRPFTTVYDMPVRPAMGERVVFRMLSVIDRVAMDYDLPLSRSWKLRAGAEGKREADWVANGQVSFDPLQNAILPYPTLSRFEGVQHIAAVHAAITYREDDWAVEAGSRLEDVRVAVSTEQPSQPVRRRVAGFAHRLSVTRDMGRDHLALRLSRSRDRLDPSDLNPVLFTVDPQNQSRGNPLLRPQDIDTAEAEYGIDHSGFQATATLYLRRTDRLIGDDYRFGADNVLLRTVRNNGVRRSIGGEVVLSGPIGKTIRYSLSGNVRSDRIARDDDFGPYRASLLGWSVQASVDWDATRRDKLHLDANRQGPELLPLGERSGTGAVNLVWRHTVSPRWTASLTARGLVQDSHIRTTIRSPLAIGVNQRVTDTRALLLGLGYVFGRKAAN
ncbi:TonB-dependent siderophore receptor [Sphingomonas sp. LC-1]|uniref:TonB-dependent receptor plug domain-containing protein n=1 Tax=Sphingomonas sp. LC-1 TaxID=3110957 RepID=UPI0021BA6FC2|nr:TonB-dependent receptor [Sphingomonas sp. LC-1]